MNKYIKRQAQKVLSKPCLLPISALFSPRYSGIGSIAMLHRVIPNNDKILCEDLEIKADYLEKTIKYFLENNYEVVSLDTVHEILINKIKIDKKFVVFTFDDGYIDTYDVAYPIFKKYKIPFTIYVTTSFPDKAAILWWYALKDLVINNKVVNFNYNGGKYSFITETQKQKNDIYLKIKELIMSENYFDSKKLIDNIFEENRISLQEYADKLTLNWTQIKELSKDNLVTIGAHTTNHYNLRKLDKESVKKEIIDSKNQLQMITGKKVEHFAFPFGSKNEASKREFQIVSELGFKTVTTTRCGNIFLNHKEHTNCLPRISISPYTESPYTQFYTNGFIPAIANKFKRIVTD
ncbi:polysaccharide deacetylase family protein [Clostridium sediminicola]|uniref:polysaccharide deacetylase family protein n=1 Tax=Clostridium sediminicola TaxID=3114879 RepID=UPI0031F24A8A